MKRLIAFLAVGMLVACSSIEDPEVFPALSFANLQPINLGAESVRVQPGPLMSRQFPNVEHTAPVSFESALRAWSSARLRANGVGNIRILVELESASLTERRLPTDSGLTGLLKNEQAVEYEARIQVSIKAVDATQTVRAQAESEVWHTRTMAEDADAGERQLLLYEMVEATMFALDDEIVPELNRHFSDFVL